MWRTLMQSETVAYGEGAVGVATSGSVARGATLELGAEGSVLQVQATAPLRLLASVAHPNLKRRKT